MRRRSSATWLGLSYGGLVIYASLYPFWPWVWPPGMEPASLLRLPWPRYWPSFDLWANALGYFPLGFLVCAALLRSRVRTLPALWWPGLGLPLLSYLMEVLQYFLPQRVPSLADWLLNSAGAEAGVLCAWLLHRFGALERWHGWRERWLAPHSAGALALLALWPVGLMSPLPLPLGLGQLLPRLRVLAAEALEDTPWAWPPNDDLLAPALPPGLEAIAVALGLLAPCMLALSVTRPGWRRVVLVLGALALAVLFSTCSTMLNYGPEHAWAWLSPATLPGLAVGSGLALLACLMSRRANAAWGLVVLTAMIALISEAPTDPYLQQSLQAWEQGRFINLYGLAQWVGWCWPFVTLGWLMFGVTQREAPSRLGSR